MNTDYIVTLLGRGGRGIFIGEHILTAAHCLNYHLDGRMVLGEHIIEEIETCKGRLKVGPVAVEPVSDIAVLGRLDDQTFPHQAIDFGEFCKSVQPMRLANTRLKAEKPAAVRIYGHNGNWIHGTATVFNSFIPAGSAPNVYIEADEEVQAGASGGPIIDGNGELIAIVSNFSVPSEGQKSAGLCPRPLIALPTWICRQLRQTQAGSPWRSKAETR